MMEQKQKLPISKMVWSGVAGAVAMWALGFFAFGWVTGGTATSMATAASEKATVVALTPHCVVKAQSDPEFVTKLASVNEVTGYQRNTKFMETGWADLTDVSKLNREIGASCAKLIEADNA